MNIGKDDSLGAPSLPKRAAAADAWLEAKGLVPWIVNAVVPRWRELDEKGCSIVPTLRHVFRQPKTPPEDLARQAAAELVHKAARMRRRIVGAGGYLASFLPELFPDEKARAVGVWPSLNVSSPSWPDSIEELSSRLFADGMPEKLASALAAGLYVSLGFELDGPHNGTTSESSLMTDLPEPFSTFLLTLGAVPPDDPCWAHTDDFLSRVRTLQSSKANELEAQRTSSKKRENAQRIAARLSEIRPRASAVLRYLKVELPDDPAEIDSERAEQLLQALDSLAEATEGYKDLQSRSAQTEDEEYELLDQKRALSAQIRSAVASVNDVLASAPAPIPPPVAPAVADQEAPKSGEVGLHVVGQSTSPLEAASPDGPAPPESELQPESGAATGVTEDETASAVAGGDEATQGPAAPSRPPAPPVISGDDLPKPQPPPVTIDGEVPTPPRAPIALAVEVPTPPPESAKMRVPAAPESKASGGLELVPSKKSWLPPSDDCDAPRLWRVLRNSDETGAYWCARALEATGDASPVPSSVLAVLCASRWTKSGATMLAGDIAELVAGQTSMPTGATRLLATAAALVPALTSPETKLPGWLDPDCEPLKGIVPAIRTFAGCGQPLRMMLLDEVTNAGEAARRRASAESQIRKWLDDAPKRRVQYQAATRVWQALVRQDFTPVADQIARGRLEGVSAAGSLVGRFNSRNRIDAEIDRHDRDLRGPGVNRIDFGARRQLVALIDSFLGEIAEWLDLAEREAQLKRASWQTDQIEELRKTVQNEFSDAFRWSEEVALSPDDREAACALSVHRSLRDLASVLRIDSTSSTPCAPKGIDDIAARSTSLMEALEARLLWCPPMALPLVDELDKHRAPWLLEQLSSPPATADDAAEQWMADGSFDAVARLGSIVSEKVLQDRDDRLAKEQRALAKEIERLQAAVEQGFVDGYVGDDRAGLMQRLGSVVPSETQQVRRARATLTDVDADLTRRRDGRLAEALREWDTRLLPSLRQRSPAQVAGQWDADVRDAHRRGDVRVLDELIAQLQSTLAEGRAPKERQTADGPPRDRLAEFKAFQSQDFHNLNLGTVIGELKENRQPLPLLKIVQGQKRRHVEDAIDRWRWLKGTQGGDRLSDGDLLGKLQQLLVEFVGFNPVEGRPGAVSQRGAKWRALSLRISDGETCPIPDFGSQSRRDYQVVCVWEHPGADTLGNVLATLGGSARPTILMYFGRLTDARRTNIRTTAKLRNVPLLVIDEVLFLFLAGEADLRMRPLFECGLPYSHVNPYTPFRAGDVPPEMYFGRQDLVQDLMRAEGRCIIYGGRQLGKSALLREVQRRFDRPPSQRAVVVDIRSVGDAAAGVDTDRLWQIVRSRLSEDKVFETNKQRPDEIVAALRQHILSKPDMRLLLMLDEADNLLDADAKERFRVVDKLRALMADTGRRFKVVLAGLHNVQRFQQLPNQPLAHFGQAIQVGPLEPSAAVDLVRKPLRALGFTFESDEDVLRILSYTNYHPGLLQLYCYNLLNTLQAGPPIPPPVRISREQVDAVYRQADVRQGIRDRFDWTLALDSRYQAIAWSLIVEGVHAVGARSLAVGELFALARSWWSKGFSSTGDDEFRGILDEMCGLGVLVGSPEDGYRLRSQNLVQLMGAAVGDRLLALSAKEPPTVFQVDRLRRLASHESNVYSPLTLGQERQLLARDWGVVLLFGSKATGTDGLAGSLKALAVGESQIAFEISDLPESPDKLPDALQRAQEAVNAGLFLLLYRAPTDPQAALGFVEAARHHCKKRAAASKRFLRIVFLFEPLAAERWLALPERAATEDSVTSVLWMHKWSEAALRERLKRAELPDSDQHVARLYNATSGWSMLVDRVFSAEAPKGVPPDQSHRQAIDRLEGELKNDQSPMGDSFVGAIGLRRESRPWKLLALLNILSGSKPLTLGSGTVELLAADMPGLTQDEHESILEWLFRFGILERRTAAQGDGGGNLPGELVVQVDPVVSALLPTLEPR